MRPVVTRCTYSALLPFAALIGAGCGRIAFDPEERMGVDAAPVTEPAPDAAPPDANPAITQVEFGSGLEADHSVGTRDTYLYQAAPTTNFGTDELLDGISVSHSLLYFDLSVIDPAMTVVDASLCLTPILNSADMGTGTLNLILQDWAEGDGMPGAPNWTQRTPTENWNTAGGDYGEAIGSFDEVTIQVRICLPLAAEAVQSWITDPAGNFGMATISTGYPGEHPHFCSREATDASCRPSLLVSLRE